MAYIKCLSRWLLCCFRCHSFVGWFISVCFIRALIFYSNCLAFFLFFFVHRIVGSRLDSGFIVIIHSVSTESNACCELFWLLIWMSSQNIKSENIHIDFELRVDSIPCVLCIYNVIYRSMAFIKEELKHFNYTDNIHSFIHATKRRIFSFLPNQKFHSRSHFYLFLNGTQVFFLLN